jgi:hypothetical protein
MKNINKVATQAANQKKAIQKEAFAVVNELINSDTFHAATLDQLTTLYSYFMPAIPNKPKTVYQWLNKIKAKNDVRRYLNYVYCDGGRLCATDGHRLLVTPNDDGLAIGFYDEAMNHVGTDIGTYPNLDRIIPATSNKTHEVVYIPTELKGLEVRPFEHGYKINIFGNVWVNRKYLLDAVSFTKDSTFIAYRNKEYINAAIKIELHDLDNAVQVIMPVSEPIKNKSE